MRFAILALPLVVAACTAALRCADTSSFTRRVPSVDAEHAALIASLQEGLPQEAHTGVANLFDREFERLRAEQAKGAEIWAFHEEKCPGCGWYRDGYVAIVNCKVVYQVTTADDM